MKIKNLIIFSLVIFTLILNCTVFTQDIKPKTFMVKMRDGVKLSTEVYLPSEKGKFPAIVTRTPYGIGTVTGPTLKIVNFVKMGYAFVVQDMRGRFNSEGPAPLVFSTDEEDGYDTIEWIAQQPWSDGNVGMFGGSAMGITQLAAAIANPPHLKCAYVSVATPNLVTKALYNNGVIPLSMVGGWLALTGYSKENANLLYTKDKKYLKVLEKLEFEKKFKNVNIPIFHLGGWFDIFSKGTIDSFLELSKDGGENARKNQKLAIGPWVHGAPSNTAGDMKFPDNASLDGAMKAGNGFGDPGKWFDWCLKGEKNEVTNWPNIFYYVIGDVSDKDAPGNVWKTTNSWPPKNNPTPFYFHKNNLLSKEKPPEKKAQKTYTFDPQDYVPTVCGNNLIIKSGSCDQSEVEKRDDVLLWTSKTLKKPLEVTGEVKVVLYVSSSAKDTDFTAKLTDVYPDGKSMLILDGIVRARFRNGLYNDNVYSEELLVTNKIYKLEFDLGPTSIIFNKGHKIRVAISSSNFPRFAINPNTGGDLSLSKNAVDHIFKNALSLSWEPTLLYEDIQTAENTIYFDKKNSSYILLPVIETNN